MLYVNMTNGCIHVRALEKKPLHTKQRNINVVEDNQINIHTKLVSINPVVSEQNIQNEKISDDNAQPCGSGVLSVAYDWHNKATNWFWSASLHKLINQVWNTRIVALWRVSM